MLGTKRPSPVRAEAFVDFVTGPKYGDCFQAGPELTQVQASKAEAGPPGWGTGS